MRTNTSSYARGVCLAAVSSLPLLGSALSAVAGTEATASSPSAFEQWWNGKRMTGDWLGARDTLEDRGIKLGGSYKIALFGVVASENGSQAYWGEDLVFNGAVDFSKLLGAHVIEGLEGFVEGRWRDNNGGVANPNETVQGSSLFNPTPWWSGTGWRMMSFGLQYTPPELFGAKDFLTLRGGWLRPQKEFIDQPLSKLFLNNAIHSAKGIGGNIPFSSSFSSWGGVVQVKPVKWHYAKVGLFMAFPDASATENHGLNFAGDPGDPSRNKLFFMGETGFTPEIGASKLPGKYAFGAYVYGQDNNDGPNNQYGFYWQADQMLFREPSAPEPSAGTSDGKSLSAPVKVDGKPALSKQGLRMFSLFAAAPTYNNTYPFYMHTGLAYEGLIPTRDKDQLFAGVAFGQYANKPGADNTVVIEGGYRAQINGWAFVQPYAQYIAQPAGTSSVANAAILGFLAGVDF